jgi:hypothetical protein
MNVHHWDFVDEDGCLHCNCGIGVIEPTPGSVSIKTFLRPATRHPELASAAESGSSELAIFSLAYMLDDRLQELTAAIDRLAAIAKATGAQP